jgi:acetyl esterase
MEAELSLDPDNQRVLDLIKAAGRPPIYTLSPPHAREAYRLSRAPFQPELPRVEEVREFTAQGPLGDIPLRYYRGIGAIAQQCPVLVFYHGGGYVIGDRDTHDYVCRKLANATKCAVVSVDYRLAPEYKFPAAVDDSAAALRWVVDHADILRIDRRCVAVGGDSAGGNLAANMAHMARNGDVPQIVFQLLFYPGTDMSMSHPSYGRDFSSFPLSTEACRYFLGHYLRGDEDKSDWRASPLLAPTFAGLAPALVLTAAYDPVSDEGIAYAKRLEESGVPVTAIHMSDQMHGFLTMGKIVRAADTALEMSAVALRRVFTASQLPGN